jgi:hypothetical protein
LELLLGRNLQSALCPLQRVFSSREVNLGTAALQALFGALF